MAVILVDPKAVERVGRAQLGVSESPRNSNRQKFGVWYGMNGVAWCAIFISWIFWHAGFPLPAIRTKKGFAYCPDLENWARNNGCWRAANSGYRAVFGDIILFSFGGSRSDHVGFVLGRLADGRYVVLEGNTNGGGSRTGGSVMIHNRRTGIRGFVVTAKVTGKPVPVIVQAPANSIMPNSPKKEIEFAQRLINTLRKKPIEVDGVYGNATKAAVAEFQRGHNKLVGKAALKVTGGIDADTLRAMAWWNGQAKG